MSDYVSKTEIWYCKIFVLRAIIVISVPAVFWDVMPCSTVDVYRLSEPFFSEDGGRTFLRNIGKYIPDYMASHTRKQQFSCVVSIRFT
jgi:hypothetical protein